MGRMLGKVTTGRQEAPLRELVYGVQGVGKTTFGADAPKPIFLGEDGTKQLDVARFPVAERWQDVTDAVQDLVREKHDYQTLCVDTLDHLHGLVEFGVAEREGRAFPDIPYGKGPDYAVDFWRALLRDLEALQAKRGMNVILLAHAQIKPFKNPSGDDYDRFVLRINDKSASLITGWVESQLFASYDVAVQKGRDKGAKKAIGVERWLYTQKIPAADAKNRYDLPPKIDLSFAEFARQLARGDKERVASMREAVEGLIEQVLDATKKARAREALIKCGDDLKGLRTIARKLAATLAEQEEAATTNNAAAAVPDASTSVHTPVAAAPTLTSGAGQAAPQAAPTRSPAPAPEGSHSPRGSEVPGAAPAASPPAPDVTQQAVAGTAPPASVASTPGQKEESAAKKIATPNTPNTAAGGEQAPPAATPSLATEPRGPVTIEEVLAWVGPSNVGHAEAAVKILAAPTADVSETPAVIARLMAWNGVDRAVVDDWWTAAGGTFTTRKVKGVATKDYAPLDGRSFSDLWHGQVRAHVPPVEDESPVAAALAAHGVES